MRAQRLPTHSTDSGHVGGSQCGADLGTPGSTGHGGRAQRLGAGQDRHGLCLQSLSALAQWLREQPGGSWLGFFCLAPRWLRWLRQGLEAMRKGQADSVSASGAAPALCCDDSYHLPTVSLVILHLPLPAHLVRTQIWVIPVSDASPAPETVTGT